MYFKRSLFVLLVLLNVIECKNMNFVVNMQSFVNNYGVKADRRCCFENNNNELLKPSTNMCLKQCVTFFRFCFRTLSNASNKCQSEFETNIIGENTINKELFNITTDYIRFPIANKNDKFQLLIEVFNDKSVMINKQERELISKWQLNIENVDFNWNLYEKTNQLLDQQLTFNYRFECSKGYFGQYCDLFNCSNGCELNKGGYCTKPDECKCKLGWTGVNCNIKKKSDVDVDCTLECRNNGVCMIEEISKEQYCKCNRLYKGKQCELSLIQTCNSTYMCQNGGTCMVHGYCLCPPGYIGDRCEVLSTIAGQCGPSKICKNDGVCVLNNNNEYECVCKSNFAGLQCELSFDPCANSINLCKNGGSCLSNGDSYKCLCTSEYTGANCDTQVTTTATATTTRSSFSPMFADIKDTVVTHNQDHSFEILLIISLGVGLPVLFILVAILVFRVCKNKKANECATTAACSSNMLQSSQDLCKIECENEDKCYKVKLNNDIKQVKSSENQFASGQNLCEKLKKSENFIENNIFNIQIHNKEKIICVNKIENAINKQQCQNLKDCKLIENEIVVMQQKTKSIIDSCGGGELNNNFKSNSFYINQATSTSNSIKSQNDLPYIMASIV